MPTYEYFCAHCDYIMDVNLRMIEISEPTEDTRIKTTCKHCLTPMIKLISLPSIIGQQDFRKMSDNEKKDYKSKMKKRSAEDAKKSGVKDMQREQFKVSK